MIRHHAIRTLLLLGSFSLLFFLNSCAHSPSNPAAVTVAPQAVDGIPTPALKPDESKAKPAQEALAAGESPSDAIPAPVEIVFNDKNYFERLDLESFDFIHLRFAHSDVAVASGGVKKGYLKILRVQGDAASCKLFFAEGENAISLSDDAAEMKPALWEKQPVKNALPPSGKCQYQVELRLPESGELAAKMVRGNFQLEGWKDPSRVRVEWGDVDFGEVQDLNVLCGRCNLSGENLKGQLKYQIENGNVGVSGLSGTVEGQTSGDTILKWRVLDKKEAVKVASQVGDIILFFPSGVSVRPDVKVPKGDFDSRLSNKPKAEAEEPEPENPNGVPVSVVANLGNVRFYRMK